ncbi:MAG: hypothetical protein HRT35_19995 [Algicola sp.]|nr:hypothetical protein [Algicola sp.]
MGIKSSALLCCLSATLLLSGCKSTQVTQLQRYQNLQADWAANPTLGITKLEIEFVATTRGSVINTSWVLGGIIAATIANAVTSDENNGSSQRLKGKALATFERMFGEANINFHVNPQWADFSDDNKTEITFSPNKLSGFNVQMSSVVTDTALNGARVEVSDTLTMSTQWLFHSTTGRPPYELKSHSSISPTSTISRAMPKYHELLNELQTKNIKRLIVFVQELNNTNEPK